LYLAILEGVMLACSVALYSYSFCIGALLSVLIIINCLLCFNIPKLYHMSQAKNDIITNLL